MSKWEKDLNIYYSGSHYVSGHCSRFDISDYSVIIETWLKKAPLEALVSNIRPGAVKELKRVIFSPKFYDSTWQGKNTLKIRPTEGTELYRMRGKEKIIYVKGISSSPLEGNSLWIATKIEGCVSGSSL